MNKKRFITVISAVLVSSVLLTAALCGCKSEGGASDSTTPAQSSATESAPAPAAARQDGDRFETVVMVEGMEETVKCEHVINETIGFELDYEYETFKRISEANRERFISIYDKPEAPEIYLDVTYDAEDADTTAAAVSAALSLDFNKVENEPIKLDGAGDCIIINASESKGEDEKPQALRTVYIIPAAKGCIVANAHYTLETGDGFGTRFGNIANTVTPINK